MNAISPIAPPTPSLPPRPHPARMGSDYDKQLKQLIDAAESAGWTVDRTSSGHFRFTPPDPAAQQVIAPGTTSADRAVQNLRGDLRRSGLVI